MGYKIVCLTCRKAFNSNLGYKHNFGKCQECNGAYVYYNHKFKPPKKTDLKAWSVINFLYQHGFIYQHIIKEIVKIRGNGKSEDQVIYADYPLNLNEAEDFVVTYQRQSIKKTDRKVND